MKLINTDTVLGSTLALLSAGLLIESHRSSSNVFLLPGDAPPFLVAQFALYLVLAISLVILLGGIRRGGVDFGVVDWRATIGLAALLIVATLLFKVAGYLLVVPLAVLGTGLILGYRRPVPLVLIGIGVPLLTYLLLVGFADMPLPTVPGLGV